MDLFVDHGSWRGDACWETRWDLLAHLEDAPLAPGAWAAVEHHLAGCDECDRVRGDREFLRACCRSSPWLDALREGSLPADTGAAVVRHVLRCVACRESILPPVEPRPPAPPPPATPASAAAELAAPAAPHSALATALRQPPNRRRAWVGGGLVLAATILPATAVLTSAHRGDTPAIPPATTSTRVTIASAPATRVNSTTTPTAPTAPPAAATTAPAPTATSAPVTAALPPPQRRSSPAATSSGSPSSAPTPAPTPTPILPPLPVP